MFMFGFILGASSIVAVAIVAFMVYAIVASVGMPTQYVIRWDGDLFTLISHLQSEFPDRPYISVAPYSKGVYRYSFERPGEKYHLNYRPI